MNFYNTAMALIGVPGKSEHNIKPFSCLAVKTFKYADMGDYIFYSWRSGRVDRHGGFFSMK